MSDFTESLLDAFSGSKKTTFSLIDGIEKDIDNFLWSLNNDNSYNEETYGGDKEFGIHPSSLCYNPCPKMILWELHELEPDFPEDLYIEPKLRRIFDNGRKVHSRWQEYFCKSGIEVLGSWKCRKCGSIRGKLKEISIKSLPKKCKCGSESFKYNEFKVRSDDHMLVGKRDLKIKVGDKYLLGEIKSINTFSFKSLTSPKPEHKLQLDLYHVMDGTEEGFFLYEDKNDQNVKFFYNKVAHNESLNSLLSTAKEIKEAYEEEHVNVTEVDSCGTCPWRKVCPKIETQTDLIKIKELNNE